MLVPEYFRKKPVTIQAMRVPRYDELEAVKNAHNAYFWVERNTLGSFEPLDCIEGRVPWPESGISIDPRDGRMIVSTLEGGMWVDPGDWIIRGIKGEFYPCKPDIFVDTYESVI